MGRRSRAAKPPSNLRPESSLPSPDRFVGNLDASLGKQFFDIAQAERISAIEPNGMLHDGWRKMAISIADLIHEISLPDPMGLGVRDS